MTKRQITITSLSCNLPVLPYIMTQKSIVLTATRLYLRLLTMADLPFLTKLHQDPDVMKYIGPPRSEKVVAERLDKILSSYISHPGYGIWLACRIIDHQPIGWACLKDLDGSEEIEIGYRLAKEHWGLGYATELAESLLSYGFNEMRLHEIAGVTRPDNIGSQHVLKKAGLKESGTAHFYDSEVQYFKITRKEWVNRIAH